MAVVSVQWLPSGGLSGKLGESYRPTEKWRVRVDNPRTSKIAIANATGQGYGLPHWDFPACKAMEFDVSLADDVGMLWIVTVQFYVPPNGKKINAATGIPEDFWQASGGTTSVPAFRDRDNDLIVNSAGDPIEGLSREREERGWVLTKFYENDTWMQDRNTYSGSTNSDQWDGEPAGKWKVSLKSADERQSQKLDENDEEGAVKKYVETKWEFRLDPDGWQLKPWDLGFQERCDSSGTPSTSGTKRKVIVGQDGKPVKQPVALSNGIAKAVGQEPDALTFNVYPTTAFGAKFGTPSIVPVPPGP
jgi:hypothetical protein